MRHRDVSRGPDPQRRLTPLAVILNGVKPVPSDDALLIETPDSLDESGVSESPSGGPGAGGSVSTASSREGW